MLRSRNPSQSGLGRGLGNPSMVSGGDILASLRSSPRPLDPEHLSSPAARPLPPPPAFTSPSPEQERIFSRYFNRGCLCGCHWSTVLIVVFWLVTPLWVLVEMKLFDFNTISDLVNGGEVTFGDATDNSDLFKEFWPVNATNRK